MLSILDEAMTAFSFGGVQAMHDPTEGGISNGLHELADASKRGFRVYEERINMSHETQEICDLFEINPLDLISSGSLLVVAEKEKASGLVKAIRKKGVAASVIGEIVADSRCRVMVRMDNSVEPLVRPLSDDLWTALARKFS
jgi:hydrogenase maturation factor